MSPGLALLLASGMVAMFGRALEATGRIETLGAKACADGAAIVLAYLAGVSSSRWESSGPTSGG